MTLDRIFGGGPLTNQFIRKWTSLNNLWFLGARASRAHFVAIHTVLRAGRARQWHSFCFWARVLFREDDGSGYRDMALRG